MRCLITVLVNGEERFRGYESQVESWLKIAKISEGDEVSFGLAVV